MPFSKLGLSPQVLEGVQAAGYTDPTPIQLRAVPLLMAGRDLIGCAQTGTGKTAAFALPILSRLEKRGALRALVLEPTRELAAQVETAIHDYGRFTNLRTAVVFGGTGYGRQDQVLRQGVDILVATPGRLLDQIKRGMVRLNQIEILVLDEADRMLDMGFMPDVRRIIERCPRARQTMLFSATIPPEIEQLCKFALRQPETVEIGQRRSAAETVTHALYPVASDQKEALLEELLKRTDFDQVLIFCRTKHGADRVARKLHQQGRAVAVLHSNRTQREREKALSGFRDGRYEVMVATDIAARGIDVEQISHVINFDVPHHPEDYVHRIGRTGRAQSVGDAFTIMTGEDVREVATIEHFIGQKIARVKLDGFDYSYTRLLDSNPPPAFGGRRPRARWR
jgi:ATP-dependent RNA helicase RhlE